MRFEERSIARERCFELRDSRHTLSGAPRCARGMFKQAASSAAKAVDLAPAIPTRCSYWDRAAVPHISHKTHLIREQPQPFLKRSFGLCIK
jgi:hypothetical protein